MLASMRAHSSSLSQGVRHCPRTQRRPGWHSFSGQNCSGRVSGMHWNELQYSCSSQFASSVHPLRQESSVHGRHAPATHCWVFGQGLSRQVMRHSPSMQIRASPHSKLNWQRKAGGAGSSSRGLRQRPFSSQVVPRGQSYSFSHARTHPMVVQTSPTAQSASAAQMLRSGGGTESHSSPRQRKQPRSLSGPSAMQT